MAAQGMILRNMALVGQTAHVPMPQQYKRIFEEGVALIFGRWTALQLAVANEWGGSSSKEKAQSLLEDVLDWFYTSKDLEQSDLEGLLDEALQVDFNVQAEDDSPYQVARSLVNMHNQVASGEVSYIETLRQVQPVSSTACQQEARPKDPEASEDSSSSEDEGEDEGGDSEGEAMEVEGTEEMEMEVPTSTLGGPIIDEDGFQLVQRKGKGRR